jgi:hypothetical protein
VARPIAGAGVQVDEDPYGLVPSYAVDGVAVNQATPLGVPPWAYAVLRTRGQPVMVVGQRGAQRIAVLGFQLFNSNWALLPGFPIVVQNLLNWLAPPLSGPAGIYRPGDVVSLVAAPNATALRVVDPAGHSVRLAPPFPAQPFTGTSQPGLYTVEQQTPAGLRRALFAVNTLPVSSSGSSGSLGSSGSPESRQPRNPGTQVPLELAPLVAALALVVLAGEWWVAARRR